MVLNNGTSATLDGENIGDLQDNVCGVVNKWVHGWLTVDDDRQWKVRRYHLPLGAVQPLS
jgi:hypothetical protein